MADRFTWVPIYREIANQLLGWQERQRKLIAFLEQLRGQGLKVTPLTDQDDQGARSLLDEIDPFTFFGVFNRGIRNEQRIAILTAIRALFGVQSPLPSDFDGIPILNNQRSWFISYRSDRKPDDVQRLWRVFRSALNKDPLDDPEFRHAFDDALEVKCTNLNLTIGMFWIRPDTFVNLDQTNRQFLKIKLPSDGLSAEFYISTTRRILARAQPLPEISYQAWLQATRGNPPIIDPPKENGFWMVGAYWSENDPPDLTQRFLDEGIWQNGYKDRYLDVVRSMRVGDRIAIKAASTQRLNLPFDARNKTVSRMTIKAIGVIAANRGDGRTVEVEWDPSFKLKDWYFYTNQQTVWRLRRDDPYAQRLIAFAFSSAAQDYDWFCQQWWGTSKTKPESPPEAAELGQAEPYDISDVLDAGVFVSEAELRQALDWLSSKKNLILQGPPGVGKNFIARKLAYALMEARDDGRIEMVQFHQSYSYEDFIRGYRPGKDGQFELKDGIFFKFCSRANADPDRPHVFIIDEINRGNLSQIFGEIMMLIEADKRSSEYALPLVYSVPEEARFYVPKNLYLIGLMNVADRSLAMVDYALRRRFAFMTLKPQYDSKRFRDWLIERNMPHELVSLVIDRMMALNEEIAKDPLLGENYQVGHSFFCPKGENFTGLDRTWFNRIVETEIAPLLQEYWFDNPKRAEQAHQRMIAP